MPSPCLSTEVLRRWVQNAEDVSGGLAGQLVVLELVVSGQWSVVSGLSMQLAPEGAGEAVEEAADFCGEAMK